MVDHFNPAQELIELNKRVFSIMGVWPLETTYFKFTIWLTYLTIHMTLLFADLFGVFGNLELMVMNLSESAFDTMIIFKLIVMRFSKPLRNLMTRIINDIDAKLSVTVEEGKIYLDYIQIAIGFFKLWVSMGIIAAIMYQLKPLEFRLKAVLQNESMPYVLAYRTRFFFEIEDSRTFWLIWTCQIPVMCMGIFHTASIGYLFSLVLHICGELSIISLRIKKIDLSRDNQSSANVFRNIVNRHRNVLGMAKDINEVFGLLLLEELVISTVLIGLTAYIVLVNVDFAETGVFVSYLIYSLTMLLLIYGYCVAGEYLILESTNLYEAYYQCQWYNESNSFKKQLLICMISANEPIRLSAGGFYTFSLVSFTSIVKTAAGYISMLRTMI